MLRENSHRLAVLLFLGVLILDSGCTRRHDLADTQAANRPTDTAAVNLNTATVDVLERLPGIGPKTAEAIVEFRLRNGPFRRVEHVMQIRGISESRFMEIRHLLRTE